MIATDLQPTTVTEARRGLHVSHSQITTYRICSMKFYFQYVTGLEPDFLPAALPFGSAIHEALADFYRHIQSTDTFPTSGDLQAEFAEAWDQKTKTEQAIKYKAKETPDSLLDLGTLMLSVYHEHLKKGRIPTAEDVCAVELPLRTSLGDVDLVGVVDLILRGPDADSYVIVDHKTAGRRFDESRAAYDTQPTAYLMLCQEALLPPEAMTTFAWDVLLKTKSPAVERFTTVRSAADFRKFRQLIDVILRAIDAEIFYPNHGWACSDCRFRNICDRS